MSAVTLRFGRTKLHKQLRDVAKAEDRSLNQIILIACAEFLKRRSEQGTPQISDK